MTASPTQSEAPSRREHGRKPEERNDIPWDANLMTGAKAAAGVYFYRVDGIEFKPGSKPNKMILLGAAR